jgi:hypothetical protein
MTTDELILPTSVSLIITVFVLFGDFNIILATIRYKPLQHPCNYLIAFNALSDLVSQLEYFIFSSLLFSGNAVMTRLLCVYWQLVPSFAGQWGMALTLAVGFDRMIGVAMPIR